MPALVACCSSCRSAHASHSGDDPRIRGRSRSGPCPPHRCHSRRSDRLVVAPQAEISCGRCNDAQLACANAYMYASWRYDERMAQQSQIAVPSPPEPDAGPSARRAPWGTISRDDIIRAAVKTVSAGGYQEMTIRSLAAELGVAPMSLYRHIRDKDDLLDEVVDRLLARAWRPSAARDDWQAWVIEAAARLRAFLVSQPAALHVHLRHPVVSPAALERMNAMMDVLRRTGADEATARRAYGAVHTYTIGFAALEASRARSAPDGGDVSSLARQLAAYTTAEQFVDGLRYLLDGIGRHAGPGPEPGR